jgi:hypothetical protein
MIAHTRPDRPAARVNDSASPPSRQQLRLISIAWALTAALASLLVALPLGLEPALRAAGCGFFYGLLAFHLQRVDPDDSHLQAGLVGAVCALRSLGGASLAPTLQEAGRSASAPGSLAPRLLSAMMEAIGGWLPLWLPLIASALLLLGIQRWLPSRV